MCSSFHIIRQSDHGANVSSETAITLMTIVANHHAQTTTLKRGVVRIRKRHSAALASRPITVNHVTFSGFIERQRWTKRTCLQSHDVILSEAMLQRSGRSPRGQAFNLRLNSGSADNENGPEMFESLASCFAFRLQRFAQHDSAICEMSSSS